MRAKRPREIGSTFPNWLGFDQSAQGPATAFPPTLQSRAELGASAKIFLRLGGRTTRYTAPAFSKHARKNPCSRVYASGLHRTAHERFAVLRSHSSPAYLSTHVRM